MRSRKNVNYYVLHHAVTPRWDDKSKAWLANWFSNNGFSRAYGRNPRRWSGLINPYTGGRSYSQAHFAGQKVTHRTPDATWAEKKAGYRLVPLVKDPWNVITWHAGNWPINVHSIGIENLGDFRHYPLEDKACKVLADFWRPQDRLLKGKTYIRGHKQVSRVATACPAKIMEKLPKIVKLINSNPKKTSPEPTPNTGDKKNIKYEPITPREITFKIDGVKLWDFSFKSWAKAKSIKTYRKSDKIKVVATATNTLGAKYYMTSYSYNGGKIKKTWGFNVKDCVDYKKPKEVKPKDTTKKPPKSTPMEDLVKGTKEHSKEIARVERLTKENNATLKQILDLVQWLVNKIKLIFK